MVTGEIVLQADALRSLVAGIFTQAGLSVDDAGTTATVLVEADLRGVGTHGVLTVPRYVERLRTGVCNPRANIRIVGETVTSAKLDADHALGQVAAVRGMEAAIARARQVGVGLATITNSSHYGAAAYYAMMALDHDLIGFSTTNSPPIMPATGARGASIGNNPFAWAVPAGGEWPLVLDMAMSVAARSKIILAQKQGERIPLGWAVGPNGQPTDDPDLAWNGWLLPVGGYKGFGMAVILEVLSGVMTGGPFGATLPAVEDTKSRRLLGHFFMAIDPGVFLPVAEFKARVDVLIGQVKASEMAEGAGEALLPGERAYRLKARRLREGIPLPPKVVDELLDLAGQLGLAKDA